MFRLLLTPTHRRVPSKRNPAAFSTSSASQPFLPPKHTLVVKQPQNPPDPTPQSPSLLYFPNLADIYNSSQLPCLSSSPSSPLFKRFDSETYEFLATRFRDSRILNEAQELHLRILKNGFGGDMFLCNTLINVYVRIGDLVSAGKLFDEMPDRNSVTWACLISGYAQNGMPNKAFLHFKQMVCAGFLPNHYAFGSALRSCQDSGQFGLKLGLQIHGLISKSQYASDVVVSNVLISMYGSCLGSIDDARRVFDEIKIRNSVSWNSIISVYSQRGDAVSAFELFSDMQKEGVEFTLKPTEFTYGSLITAACCLSNSSFSLLEQMLSRVERSGFLQDLYVGSALVSGFARSGSIDNAKKIFEQMSERNSVSMNGLMVGLVRQKQGEEAAEVFTKMKDLVGKNIDSYVILLSSFAEFSVLEEGKRKGQEVHAYVTRTCLVDMKVAIGNGLVNMYAKCGAIGDSCSVFRTMIDKDLVTWNSMIAGLDQNGYFEDAVMRFCEMKRSGMVPSNFTLISALSSCSSLGWILLGQQVHCEALKSGLDLDVSVSNSLLALYAETGYLNECQKVFFLMPEYDQVSWNSIIGALAGADAFVLEAVKYFMGMMQSGLTLNKVTFINILAAVSSLSNWKLGQQIHTLVLKHHVVDDCTIENALIAFYGKCGEMNNCEKIFSRMSERRDEVSWNSMISGYIHNELLPKAMDMVWYMMQRGQRLDCFTFATVLSACASVATLERGMEVHACSVRACLESDVVVGSALVDMYSKCGRVDYASRFFELMPLRNFYSWNSMISGYARHGQGGEALKLFEQMKLHGQPPDHVTFVGVLSACSHVGLVHRGFEHFKSMIDVYGLGPRMEHYSCMVDLLGRAGELSKIEDFINKMPMEPNVLIWRTVLGACCRANGCNTDLGRRAAEMLLELEPQNAVNYVLLSNMYASGGKWEDVAKARTAMRKAAVKKEAGCSWVTMKDGVHVFVAGDKSHPENELIYNKLKELNRKMKDAGYVPETKFALYDLDVENKEELLSYHSEKLAVAFVLTRRSELPIRIMKNLRICGDCHSAFKYISKIVGRQIVLRDSNRFHHFEDGKCSCGDYW
ncbi:putative pentatricopeptide repeat-containing protein At5g09950 [Ziziphus jujuba]|uniref:Pentatricopeptide repeat-containing protein At5g09950 n=1 Tax=Ziziphus jujuba TaxID=326968 RepID=A0A6P4BNJ0_ZIZJJ|nr:putative pentatricopeptide repeat-containing protein At5g09950 [Ziziphus jujuba]